MNILENNITWLKLNWDDTSKCIVQKELIQVIEPEVLDENTVASKITFINGNTLIVKDDPETLWNLIFKGDFQ